jgi:esterase/lipase|tara:strand:- start:7250 stop:8422 length:1173 start_codon:yes stop_codon:yes gene_type:complete
MSDLPPYFMWFPKSYRWSSALLNIISTAPFGGADISEVYQIRRMLETSDQEDDEAWFKACNTVAQKVEKHAEGFYEEGFMSPSAAMYLRASNYYQMAERFRTPKDEKAINSFKMGVDCFHKFIQIGTEDIEIVEIPYEGKSLPAYFVRASGNNTKEPTPCVIYFDGLDITKEIQYLRGGISDLIKRGISVLIVDGPGTGEAIRLRGHHLRYDFDVAGSACIDWLEKRKDVNPNKIGIVAISLGGYYAPRCASLDHRFAACIAWGAIWDYHATWKKRIDNSFQTSLSVPGHHIKWILGVDTLEEALNTLEDFRLDGVVQNMKCPFLIVHGEDDEQVPLEDAKKLFAASGSTDKTLRIFTAKEGGAQHCQRDYLTLGVYTMWNWFEEKLIRS